MNNDSTRPVNFPRVDQEARAPWQREETAIWSLGAVDRRLVGSLGRLRPEIPLPDVKNTNGVSTLGPQKFAPPNTPPPMMAVPAAFGKKAFQPVSQWEGVVESVAGASFCGRMVQLHSGQSNRLQYDFNEFSLFDLADEDRALVQPGAVFYWTVGRLKNPVGTIMNTSLVRFRRIPANVAYRHKEAELEAQRLLDEFDAVDPV